MQIKQHSPKKQIPWWLYIIFATIFYIAGKYILPTYSTTNHHLQVLSQVAPNLTPIGSIIFLLLAANALYRSTPQTETEDNPE